MSAGLLSQLDTYYSWIDEAQDPIHPDEVAALIDTRDSELTVPVPAKPRPGWMIAVAVAVVTFVLAGASALLLGPYGSVTPEATTLQIDSLPSLAWSRVPHNDAVFGRAGMSSLVVGGPGLVAAGRTGSGSDDEGDAAVWTSVDGFAWSRVPADPAIFGGNGNQAMFDVTVGGPGFVGVGFDDSDAAVWTSVDGFAWSRVPADPAIFGGPGAQFMFDVTVGGPGLVAVGGTEFDGSGSDGHAAVWTSVDGLTWSRVVHDEDTFDGPDNQAMLDVTVGGPGLVAVGSDGLGYYGHSGGQVAAVWTSVDGLTWSRVSHDAAAFGRRRTAVDKGAHQAMLSVTVGGPGLVAVGLDYSDAAVWTSTDGASWSRVPDDDVSGRGTMRSVTATDFGLVAVGDGTWGSADGSSWSKAPQSHGIFGYGRSPTAFGDRLVVLSEGDNDSDAAVWVAVPEE